MATSAGCVRSARIDNGVELDNEERRVDLDVRIDGRYMVTLWPRLRTLNP